MQNRDFSWNTQCARTRNWANYLFRWWSRAFFLNANKENVTDERMSIKSDRGQKNLPRVLLFIFFKFLFRFWCDWNVCCVYSVKLSWIEQSGLFLYFLSLLESTEYEEKKLVPNKGNASVWMCDEHDWPPILPRPIRIRCSMFGFHPIPDMCVRVCRSLGNRCIAEMFQARKTIFFQINPMANGCFEKKFQFDLFAVDMVILQ